MTDAFRYSVTRSTLIVTKPSGEVVEREVVLFHNKVLDTLGIMLIGESQLKGYCFEIVQGEFRRARDAGDLANELPRLT